MPALVKTTFWYLVAAFIVLILAVPLFRLGASVGCELTDRKAFCDQTLERAETNKGVRKNERRADAAPAWDDESSTRERRPPRVTRKKRFRPSVDCDAMGGVRTVNPNTGRPSCFVPD